MASNELPAPSRFITDHNAEGKAVFNNEIPEEISGQMLGEQHKFFLGYATTTKTPDFENNKDLDTYKDFIANPPGLTVPGGSVLRIVDYAPKTISPMHRTVSLDYAVVLDGEIDLILDSGEQRTMKRGDVAIQRATMHQWINKSETEWARMLYVLQESKPLTIDGNTLEESFGEELKKVIRPSKV